MARSLIVATLLAKTRTTALVSVRSSQPIASLISINNHSQLAQNKSDSDIHPFFVPISNSYSDDIILRNGKKEEFDLRNMEERDHDYILHLKEQVFLRQRRKEWLRYNLAMKDCREEIFFCSSGMENGSQKSEEHAKLYEMKDYLADHLRTFFVKTHNYSIYHKDIIFENNYFDPPRTHTGINSYILQLNKYRWLASFRYAHAKFEILKITAMEADHSIRVRWRITGLTNMAAFTKFWKFFPGKYRESLDQESDWHDGYSTFYLNRDGVIVKHKVDRVMPDDEMAVEKKTGLAAKLALTIGLFLGPSFGD